MLGPPGWGPRHGAARSRETASFSDPGSSSSCAQVFDLIRGHFRKMSNRSKSVHHHGPGNCHFKTQYQPAGRDTGHGGKHEPAGIVHRGEFVFTKESTSRIGVANLYRLMRGYASGGLVGGGSAAASGIGGINVYAPVSVTTAQSNDTKQQPDTPQRWYPGPIRITPTLTRWSPYLSRRWWHVTALINWR